MRLVSLVVSGFRGFAAEQTFDLDADAVIIVGTNGNGKTSLFDAILWAVCGKVPRLGTDETHLLNQFSETGLARVALTLRHDNSLHTITRTFDGQEGRISIRSDDEISHGPQAEARVIQLLWSRASSATDPMSALASVVSRSVYLQQDLVRQFIESATDHERYVAVSELVGAGRASELLTDLEKAKAAWTRATNARAAELEGPRARLGAMESRLQAMQSRRSLSMTPTEARWSDWWDRAMALGVSIERGAFGTQEATIAIDLALKQLETLRQAVDRRASILRGLQNDLESLASLPVTDRIKVESALSAARDTLGRARREVEEETERASRAREDLLKLQEKREQLRAMARLALGQLGETCPVCEQNYDRARTRERLTQLVHDVGPVDTPIGEATNRINDLLGTIREWEGRAAKLESELQTVEDYFRRKQDIEHRIHDRLSELGLEIPTTGDAARILHTERERLDATFVALASAQREGEQMGLAVSIAGEEASMSELEAEVATLKTTLAQEDANLAARIGAGDEAKRIIDGLRNAMSDLVRRRIEEIGPLLREMYERIDVHPAFRVVQFLTSIVRGRGQLTTIVKDPLRNIECGFPAAVLSSSQLNALAVCTFLSLNLAMAAPPFASALLDDPLQSLDDINLLGLIDLLRRSKDQRQLCVSTHDKRFGQLLARKLRPRSAEQRTTVIELEAWDRDGPLVRTYSSAADPEPLRLLA